MYQQHLDFIEWARKYDTGSVNMRSKEKHNERQKLLQCKQIVLNGADDLEENFGKVQTEVNSVSGKLRLNYWDLSWSNVAGWI